jgi:hypothetical protein
MTADLNYKVKLKDVIDHRFKVATPARDIRTGDLITFIYTRKSTQTRAVIPVTLMDRGEWLLISWAQMLDRVRTASNELANFIDKEPS